MSVIWGNKAENNNFVLGYEIVYNNTDVYVDFWVWTRVSIADTVNTFTCQLTGATPYQGSVEIHTNSNTEWSYQNQKFIYRAVTKNTEFNFSASLSGINYFGASQVANISGSGKNYTDIGAPSLYNLNYENNTIAFYGYLPYDAKNNSLQWATLYWTTNGSEPAGNNPATSYISLPVASGGYYEHHISIPENCTVVKAITYVTATYNTTYSNTNIVNVVYYKDPFPPSDIILNFQTQNPSTKETIDVTWTKGTQGNSDTPLTGYRIKAYRTRGGDTIAIKGINPDAPQLDYLDTNSLEASYEFVGSTLGFEPKDKIQFGICACAKNGRGDILLSSEAKSATHTFRNDGSVNIKINGSWHKGQVWIKINNQWTEAEEVYIKNNGQWNNSI